MNAIENEKRVTGVSVGDRVEVYPEGRIDFRMSGVVKQNDAEMCVIGRDDVPPAVMYVGNGVTVRSKKVEVPLNIYIFGDAEDRTYRSTDVVVNRI